MMSQSDPDAARVRKGGGDSRPRYQNHRVIDDAKGVITATETTLGSIAENKKLMDLIDQHESHTRCQVQTVVADHKSMARGKLRGLSGARDHHAHGRCGW